jgi:hypothetical protein
MTMKKQTVSQLVALSLVLAAGCKVGVIGAVGEGGTCSTSTASSTQPPRTGADRQVRDMTADEARAWCERYVGERYPLATQNPPPERPRIDLQGPSYPDYIEGYAGSQCDAFVPGGLCALQPTVDDCVLNLRHAPCEATIAALDDCVDTFFSWGAGGWCATPVGAGCGPFLGAAHCEETVIMQRQRQPPPDPYGTTPFQGDGCSLRLGPDCGSD